MHYLLRTTYYLLYLLLTTYHLLLTTYYLLLTTYYLLLTTYFSLLTTYYLLLTAYCLLLTAYCSLLTMYCLLLTTYSKAIAAYSLTPTPPPTRGRRESIMMQLPGASALHAIISSNREKASHASQRSDAGSSLLTTTTTHYYYHYYYYYYYSYALHTTRSSLPDEVGVSSKRDSWSGMRVPFVRGLTEASLQTKPAMPAAAAMPSPKDAQHVTPAKRPKRGRSPAYYDPEAVMQAALKGLPPGAREQQDQTQTIKEARGVGRRKSIVM